MRIPFLAHAAALAALLALPACAPDRPSDPPAEGETAGADLAHGQAGAEQTLAGAPGAPGHTAKTSDAGDPSGHPHHGAAPEAGDPAGASLYVLDATWTDQDGEPVAFSDLAGRPRVVAMAYTHCTWACPRIIADMKRIEAQFSDLPAERSPGFVLVSIDPERDTPERLAFFARGAGLDPARWTLLTGPDDQVLELSVLLGVKYRAAGDGEFSHSNLLTVLDAEGTVVARVEGLAVDPQPAIDALRRLVGSAS